MDIVNLISANMPSGFWENIIGWFHNFITSYGWTIIVFTICLKLVLTPLDFYQKASMRKTQKQQALLKPELDKIKEKYGDNKELVNQKTMELYQQNKISPMGGCFGMLINLVLTMVIFFTLFSSMNNISQFKVANEYTVLQQEYTLFVNGETTIKLDGEDRTYLQCYDYAVNYYDNLTVKPQKPDGTDYENSQEYAEEFALACAQTKVSDKFNQIKEGWLWIDNIFRPDTNASAFPQYSEFLKSTNNSLYNVKTEEGTDKQYYYISPVTNQVYYLTDNAETNAQVLSDAKVQGESDFNTITKSIQLEYGSWNGYFILIILSAGATLLSQLLANVGVKAKNKKGEEVSAQQKPNAILMIVLPLMMVWFTWSYSAAFAIYIIINSIMSALIGMIINILLSKFDNSKPDKKLVTVTDSSKTTLKGKVKVIDSSDYRIVKKGKIVEEKKEKTKSTKQQEDKGDK